MHSRFETKAARDRARPLTPSWSVLAGPVPVGGREPEPVELLRLAEHGLDATGWLLTPADYTGATAHLWMPAGERHVRLDVLLIA